MDPMLTDLLNMDMSALEKIIRTIGVYLTLLILIRLFGKRLMAQMNSQDLVVVLLLSNVVQNAIIGNDTSLLGGAVGAVVLVLANWFMDRLSGRYPRLNVLLSGRSTAVVTDGAPDLQALRRLSITRHELAVALHEQGADRVEDVELATLEPGGAIMVRVREEDQSVSRADLERAIAGLREHLDARLGPA